MSQHAKLAPSSAARWLACPASAAAAQEVVSPDTEYSTAGTVRHAVAAQWLTTGSPPAVGSPIEGEDIPAGTTVTQEMLDDVREGVAWVADYAAAHRGDGEKVILLIEERVEIGPAFGLPKDTCYGTMDVGLLSNDEMVVFDHKFGYQTVVVEKNPQLLSYAVGFCDEMGWLWPTIRLVINQPKGEGITEWTISKAELLKWREEQAPAFARAAAAEPVYVPGEEQCRYCPAAGICKALQEKTLALAKQEFLSAPAAFLEHISLDSLSEILQKADLIAAALKAAQEHARALALSGVKVPGFKVVRANKHRAWKAGVDKTVQDNAHILGYDLDDIAPRKLISPAQAEKKGLKQLAEAFAEKPLGEPVLAPESDKRPEYQPFENTTDTMKLLE